MVELSNRLKELKHSVTYATTAADRASWSGKHLFTTGAPTTMSSSFASSRPHSTRPS